ECGCDEVVTKPYPEDAIFGVLERRLGLRFLREAEDPGEAARAATVLREYVKHLPRELHELRAAAASGDVEALRRLAHGLRGSSLPAGVPGAAACAARVERGADAGLPADAALALVDALQLEVERTLGEMQARVRA